MAGPDATGPRRHHGHAAAPIRMPGTRCPHRLQRGCPHRHHPAASERNPLVDMQAPSPTSKLDDPGIGLRGNGRRVLTYSDLRSTFDGSGRPRAEPHDRTAPDRPHGSLRLVVRRDQVLVGRAAASGLRRAAPHRPRQRHDDDAPDSPARDVERSRRRRGPVPGAEAHHRHAAGQPPQLPRHGRRARPLGLSLPPAVSTWKPA